MEGFENEHDQEDGNDGKEAVEEQFVGMNTFEIFDAMVGMLRPEEVFASVVLDTGCINSVAGKGWFNNFVSTLSPKTKQQIKVTPSDKMFKFGGDSKRKSLGFYQIPCALAKQNIILGLNIVDTDIPCLVSKEAMKRVKDKIDIDMDELEIFGRKLKLDVEL